MLFSLTRRNLNLNYFTECLQLSTSRSELPVKINLSIKRYRRVETKCHVNKKQKKKKFSSNTKGDFYEDFYWNDYCIRDFIDHKIITAKVTIESQIKATILYIHNKIIDRNLCS